MTCPDCIQAQTVVHWGGYHAWCQGCKVRALAKGQQFWLSWRDKYKTHAYECELQDVFGPAGAEAGHEEVKAEFKRLRAMGNTRGTP